MNLTSWAWIVVPLGVCRAVQLALWDRVFDSPRRWALGRLNPRGLDMEDPGRPYLSYLLECPWCLSVWVGSATVGLIVWDATRAVTLAVLTALALSLVAVVIDRAVDKWLPDEPHTRVTLTGPGVSVEGPPGHVAEAFKELTGDEPDGTG